MEEIHDEPIMPHRIYGAEELLKLYPPLEAADEAVEDEQLEDGLLARGIEVAEQIVKDTMAFGRRRVQKAIETRPLSNGETAYPPGKQVRLAQVRRQERPPTAGA